MALRETALDYIAESAVAPRGFFAMLIDPATLKWFAPEYLGPAARRTWQIAALHRQQPDVLNFVSCRQPRIQGLAQLTHVTLSVSASSNPKWWTGVDFPAFYGREMLTAFPPLRNADANEAAYGEDSPDLRIYQGELQAVRHPMCREI